MKDKRRVWITKLDRILSAMLIKSVESVKREIKMFKLKPYPPLNRHKSEKRWLHPNYIYERLQFMLDVRVKFKETVIYVIQRWISRKRIRKRRKHIPVPYICHPPNLNVSIETSIIVYHGILKFDQGKPYGMNYRNTTILCFIIK